jgi:hypothetical protein
MTENAPAVKSPKKTGGTNKAVRRPATAQKRPSRYMPNLTTLRDWCAGLNFSVKPTVHVNGPSFLSCVLTVDFGTPLVQERLDQDQQNELATLMVRATGDVMGREGHYGINNDLREGIWYTTARA